MGIATVNMSVKVEGSSWATCHTYADRPPILTVGTPAAYLTLSGRSALPVGGEEVEFARSLLRAVQTYLAQVEAWARQATVSHTRPTTNLGCQVKREPNSHAARSRNLFREPRSDELGP